MFNDSQRKALSGPLPRSHVKTNPRGYDYVEGWKAIDEANRIFGFDGWDRETLETIQLGEPEQDNKGNWRVGYRCRVRITVRTGDERIVRDGSGYGSGIVKDIRDAHESAVKEAETDAMKRALMTFGNPFGLALYDKSQANVADESDESRLRFVAECEATIASFADPAGLRAWWSSDEQKAARRFVALTQAELDSLMGQLKNRLETLEGKKAA